MSEISQKQLEANRENAKLGGVKTNEGKARSKYNAVKHGLLSVEVLIQNEDEEKLIELGKRLRDTLKPVGEIEMIFTDRIIGNVWRLKRLLRIESTTMEWRKKERFKNSLIFPPLGFSGNDSKERAEKEALTAMITSEDIEKVNKYEISIERSIYKALHELQRLQSMRNGDRLPAPFAVDIDVSSEK